MPLTNCRWVSSTYYAFSKPVGSLEKVAEVSEPTTGENWRS